MISVNYKLYFFIVAASVVGTGFAILSFNNIQLREQIQEYQARIKESEIRAQERTDALNQEINRITKEAENEQEKNKKQVVDLRHNFNTRINRMCADRANTNLPDNARTENQKDGAESNQDLGAVVTGIAARGDEAIIKLNACIDAYNAARAQVNRK